MARWWTVLAIATGFTRVFGAQSPFQQYASKPFPVPIDDRSFGHVVGASDRDYATVVLFTALSPSVGCDGCWRIKSEWEVLAKSWQKNDKASRTLFVTLDFESGKAGFRAAGLEKVPVVMFYPPTTRPGTSSKAVMLDIGSPDVTADRLHQVVSSQLVGYSDPPVFVRPVDYGRLVQTVATVGLGVVTVGVTGYFVAPILLRREVFASTVMLSIVVLTSGIMFNFIRGTPYARADKGGVQYVAPGFQDQFGAESTTVAVLYGVLALGLHLGCRVIEIKDGRTQTLAIIIWIAFMHTVFTALVSLFRMKNGSYPFSLPPFGR